MKNLILSAFLFLNTAAIAEEYNPKLDIEAVCSTEQEDALAYLCKHYKALKKAQASDELIEVARQIDAKGSHLRLDDSGATLVDPNADQAWGKYFKWQKLHGTKGRYGFHTKLLMRESFDYHNFLNAPLIKYALKKGADPDKILEIFAYDPVIIRLAHDFGADFNRIGFYQNPYYAPDNGHYSMSQLNFYSHEAMQAFLDADPNYQPIKTKDDCIRLENEINLVMGFSLGKRVHCNVVARMNRLDPEWEGKYCFQKGHKEANSKGLIWNRYENNPDPKLCDKEIPILLADFYIWHQGSDFKTLLEFIYYVKGSHKEEFVNRGAYFYKKDLDWWLNEGGQDGGPLEAKYRKMYNLDTAIDLRHSHYNIPWR